MYNEHKVGKKKYTCKVTVQSPSINYKTANVTKGDKFSLALKGTNQKITWKSSNKAVASVSKKGIVTTKKAGTCTITATVLGKKYTCKLSVTAPAPTISSVWLSATGSKYHKIPDCGNMNPAKARKVSLNEAAGIYDACSKCF